MFTWTSAPSEGDSTRNGASVTPAMGASTTGGSTVNGPSFSGRAAIAVPGAAGGVVDIGT